MRGILIVIMAAFGLLLTACGGGSGGGSGGGGTGGGGTTIETNTLSVSRTSVALQSARYGTAEQQVVRVTISGQAEQLILGTLPGEALPRWLDVQLDSTGSNRGNLFFRVSDSDLEPGEYQTTLRVLTSNLAETEVFDTADIQITYTVTPYVPIAIDVAELNIGTAPIQAPISRSITLMGAGISWENRNAPDGITISPRNGIIPATGQVVDISIDPTRVNFDGASTIYFNEVGVPVDTELQIIFEVIDGVFPDPGSLAFMANSGSTDLQSQSITIDDFDLTTEAQINWSAASDQSWLSVDPSGVIDTATAIPSQATVEVDPTGLAVGLYDGSIRFTNDVSSHVIDLPVKLVIAQQNIITSRSGVALSSPSKLQETITVSDNTDLNVPWAATTNASWLNVTASGAAGEPLILTANPAGLANNSLSEAIVTVTSPLSNIATSKTINVGFWNSTTAPSDVTIPNILPTGETGIPSISIVTDPIRPYLYILTGMEVNLPNNFTGFTYELRTINVYTGEQVGPLVTPATTEESKLVISDDGQSLFIFPVNSIDFDTQYERYILNNFGSPNRLTIEEANVTNAQYTRVNGIAYLIGQNGEVIDPETGAFVTRILPDIGFGFDGVGQNGVICANGFTTEVSCYELFGTGVAGEEIVESLRNVTTTTEILVNITPSPDGSAFYGNIGGTVFAYDDNGMELFNIPGGFDFSVADDGAIISVGFDETDPFQVSALAEIYTPDGNLISSVMIPEGTGVLPSVIQSGDGQRIIYFDADATLDTLHLVNRP